MKRARGNKTAKRPTNCQSAGVALVKTGPQNNDASSGATLNGVRGVKLSELGYDLRSTIVHGGAPQARDIKLKGEQVELNVFVEATAAILRAALHKALKQLAAGGRLSIAWDDLVLPVRLLADRSCA